MIMMESLEGLDMEQVLRKALSIHEQSVQESAKSLSWARAETERLQEQNKQLQKENGDLHFVIRKLQASVGGDQNRDGRCCEIVRQSLQDVISSGKQLATEKDVRIKHLENEVRRYKRKLIHMADSLDLSCTPLAPPETPQPGGSNPAPPPDQLPDTTTTALVTSSLSSARPDGAALVTSSLSSERLDGAIVQPVLFQGAELDQQGAELVNPRDTDCLFSKAEAENVGTGPAPRLRLQRRGYKRSRYTEEISPEHKRPCQVSPTSNNKFSKEYSPKVDKRLPSGNMEARTLGKHRKTNHKQKYQVLVPDTCMANADDSLTADGIDAAISKEDDTPDRNMIKWDKTSGMVEEEAGNRDEINMVVPETLAVDIDAFQDSDEEVEDSAGEKLSAIMEVTVRESRAQFVEDRSVGENESRNSQRKVANTVYPENENSRQFSLRDALYRHVDGRNSSDEEESTMKDLDELNGSAIVCVTDEEEGDDTMPSCSQTFGKSCNKKKTQNKKGKLKDIDDLFNSPSKSPCIKDAGLKDKSNKGNAVPFKNKKHLFKKRKSFDEVEADVILRRSPRKHKINSLSDVVNKSLSKLANGRKHVGKTDVDSELDPDMTIDPSDMTENQSLDCYNVVPIRNGEAVSDNMFQIQVPRRHGTDDKTDERNTRKHGTDDKPEERNTRRHGTDDKPEEKNTRRHGTGANTGEKKENSVKRYSNDIIAADKNVEINQRLNETMKSPSLFCNEGKSKKKLKGRASQRKEIVTVSSSPSVEVLSDPESPLLLIRDNSNTSDVNESQWTSKALGKKLRKSSNPSANARTPSRKVSLRSSSCVSRPGGSLKAWKSLNDSSETSTRDKFFSTSVGKGQQTGKKLLQTTLTQGFFGLKDQGSDDEDGSDAELQEALRQSLMESENVIASQALAEDTDAENVSQILGEGTKSKADRKDFQTIVEDSDDDADVIITKPGTPFKKPSNVPMKREPLSRRKKKSPSTVNEIIVKSDGTMDEIDSEESGRVLQEIQIQDSNVDGFGNQINESLDPAVFGNQINGSLDPAAELSELCREPELSEMGPVESLPSLDIAADFRQEDLQSVSQSATSHFSAARGDDSQDIPCSSRSYTFGPRRNVKTESKSEMENVPPEDYSHLLTDSFDRPPKKSEVKIAHVAVVRKKDERQKLLGHGCKQCLEYYRAAGRSEDEISRRMQQCSRHRAIRPPPDTPPHFWSVGFEDTQECLDRGYLQIEDVNTKDNIPAHRRRRPLKKCFRSKNEASYVECDSEESPPEVDHD